MKNLLIKGWTKDSLAAISDVDYRLKDTSAGIPNTRYASLSWGVFDEEIYTKSVERYGRTLFDTKTKKITGFAEVETTYNNYDFDPVAFAWNVDPLAHKFPGQSPYSAFDGNPINKTDPDGRAGEPVVKDGQLTIYAHILFYGSAANPKLAEIAANNISSQWSAANGTVTFKGTAYTNVHFVTTYEVVEEKVAQSRASMNQGEAFDPQLNFARIESRSEVGLLSNRVTGKIAGDNSFYLLAEDIRPGNTSQAHEMGHGFGMGKHVSSFEKLSGLPRIMSTIHAAVEGKYTVDGMDGIPQGQNVLPLHPLNPDNRRVTQDDLNGIQFRDTKGGLGSSQAGNSTNILFKKTGDPYK